MDSQEMDENIQMIYDTKDQSTLNISNEQNILNQMEIILQDDYMAAEAKVQILAQQIKLLVEEVANYKLILQKLNSGLPFDASNINGSVNGLMVTLGPGAANSSD